MEWRLTVSGGTYQGKPLSGEAVRRWMRDLANGVPRPEAARRLLRWSFPLRWRWYWLGDPVRQYLREPEALREVELAAFLFIPKERTAPPRELDEWDRLREANRDPVQEQGAGVELDRVCRLVEWRLGPAWYWNPERWDTLDGYAPYDAVWKAWHTLQMDRALDRVTIACAIATTKAGDKAQGMLEADVREALGG